MVFIIDTQRHFAHQFTTNPFVIFSNLLGATGHSHAFYKRLTATFSRQRSFGRHIAVVDMWESIRWQILNGDEIEVSPEHRSLAWRELIINVASNTPLDNTFRTMFQKADFENFDYNTPIVYNLKTKTLTMYNERIRAALNRPVRFNDQTVNVNIAYVFLFFICIVLLSVLVVFFDTNIATDTKSKNVAAKIK
ncbi:unknown [Plutella xylostella multiple nucleopolyhedrovirus]|uniref:Pif-6 n=1 Tax=Plutella xylostella multiple nucleopolyhedrovirus TaxID=379891 RepID=Q0GYF4_9ABAC|nr:unknown [Plutella xylostella multiple nucleopolyhedrovirus]